MDDGFVVIPRPKQTTEHAQIASGIANHIRSDLLEAGFVYNISKSNWIPAFTIDWLGMRWDTTQGTLKILDRRIEKIRKSIQFLLQQPFRPVIRDLHSFVGQIISLSPVVGNISRLMTRHCQMSIAAALDESLQFVLTNNCLSELMFWNDNVMNINNRFLFSHRVVKGLVL